MSDKHSLSYENSLKMVDRKEMVVEKLNDLIVQDICKSMEAAVRQTNKAVYEMAEEQGVSIWDICLNFVPDYGPKVEFKKNGVASPSYTFEMEVKLVPIQFEFEKGPSYWERKYLELLNDCKALIEKHG